MQSVGVAIPTTRVERHPDQDLMGVYRCYHVADFSLSLPCNLRLKVLTNGRIDDLKRIFTIQFWFTVDEKTKCEFGLQQIENSEKLTPFVFTTHDGYRSACENGNIVEWEEKDLKNFKDCRLVSSESIDIINEFEIEYFWIDDVISVFINRECVGFIFTKDVMDVKMIRFGVESMQFLETSPIKIYRLMGNMP